MAMIDINPTAEAIDARCSEWRVADQRVRQLHETLAGCPGGDEETWDALVLAKKELDNASRSFGAAVGRWIALGGTLDLVDPAPPAAHTNAAPELPAPKEPAKTAQGNVAEAGVLLVGPTGQALASAEPEDAGAHADARQESTFVDPPTVDPASNLEPEGLPIPAAVPRAAPATQEQLDALVKYGVGGKRREVASAEPARALAHMESLTKDLRSPLQSSDLARVAEQVRQLHRLDSLPDSTFVLVVSAIAARLRALQIGTPHPDIDSIMPELTAWMKRRRRGFVHGLARDHEPKRGSWDADAEAALADLRGDEPPGDAAGRATEPLLSQLRDAVDSLAKPDLQQRVLDLLDLGVAADDLGLVKAVADRYEDLKGNGRLERLRKAVQAHLKSQRPDQAAGKDAPPDDWPFWHITRGKTAVIVGGDPRASNRDRIKKAFDFARVEWPEHDANLLQRLAERAASGTVDVFLFNRFGGHVMDNIVLAAVREDLSRWVRIDNGYGVRGVRQAMEEHWSALGRPR